MLPGRKSAVAEGEPCSALPCPWFFARIALEVPMNVEVSLLLGRQVGGSFGERLLLRRRSVGVGNHRYLRRGSMLRGLGRWVKLRNRA